MTESKSKSTYKKGELYEINVKDLQTDPNQPRKFFDQEPLDHLVASVQDHGLLQPVLFRVDQDGNLFVVAGERRVQAVKKAGLESIPAILTEGNPDEIALMENILREDLTTIEFAEALDRIMKEHAYTQEQLTGIIGKAKSTISEILSLINLPDHIRDECRRDPKVSRKALIKIAKKKKPQSMLKAYIKHKEKVATPPKPRGPKGGRKSLQEKFTSRYEEFMTFVTEMNFGPLDTHGRNDLISRIEDLKKTADILIAQIQKAPVKVTPPPKPKKVVKKKKPVAKPAPKKDVPKVTKPAPKKEVKKTSGGAKPKTKKLEK
jgi:ParB family transcriptional regulator, chromosome partitioning protein